MRWTRPCPTWSDSAACQRRCIQVAMLCAGCDGGQHTVDQRSAAGCCAGCLPCFEDGCSRHHLPAEKCGRRCSSTDAVSGQDGLAAILRRCAARRYRRYGRVCCCCRRLVSRCLRFYNLRFIGRGKKPLAHPSLLPLTGAGSWSTTSAFASRGRRFSWMDRLARSRARWFAP